jgi:hypothetical protein
MRSRPQEGQNFDFPVISLPQREQNMRASYAAVRLSQAERVAYREMQCSGMAGRTSARQRGRGAAARSRSSKTGQSREETLQRWSHACGITLPRRPAAPLPSLTGT